MNNPPFSADKPEDSLGLLLWQTTISWQRLIKKELEPYNISHAQFVIMAILLWWHGKKVAITQVDIIKMSKLDKMTVSKSLKKLVTLGLVLREENSIDTRAKNVYLTVNGRVLISKLVPIIENVDLNFFNQLEVEEQNNLTKIFRKLSSSGV